MRRLSLGLALVLCLRQSMTFANEQVRNPVRQLDNYYSDYDEGVAQGDDASANNDDDNMKQQEGQYNNNNAGSYGQDTNQGNADGESASSSASDGDILNTAPSDWGVLDWALVVSIFLVWGFTTACICELYKEVKESLSPLPGVSSKRRRKRRKRRSRSRTPPLASESDEMV